MLLSLSTDFTGVPWRYKICMKDSAALILIKPYVKQSEGITSLYLDLHFFDFELLPLTGIKIWSISVLVCLVFLFSALWVFFFFFDLCMKSKKIQKNKQILNYSELIQLNCFKRFSRPHSCLLVGSWPITAKSKRCNPSEKLLAYSSSVDFLFFYKHT